MSAWQIAVGITIGMPLGAVIVSGERLVAWAFAAARLGWGDPRCWMAQPILAVAFAAAWVLHPRRTLANWRSWNEPEQLAPPLRFNSEWIKERREDPDR
jgi:hypothetical protein